MIENLSSVFTSVVGLSIAGIVGVLVVTAIRIMSRHSILLYGSVSAVRANGRYRSRFRLQNLEEVSYPGKFNVSITGNRPAVSSGKPMLGVKVYAGPQRVYFTKSVLKESTSNASKIVQWIASFDGLPPYDAWLFTCDSNCETLELWIDTGPRGTWLKRRIKLDLYPTSLKIKSGNQGSRYAGATTTPPKWILYAITTASLLIYLAFSYPKLNDVRSIEIFLAVCGLLIVLLSTGFVLIRRPVYPIIQGYLAETRAVNVRAEK